MDDLSPSLLLLWDVKRSLAKGFSVANGVQMFLLRQPHDSADKMFKTQVTTWWLSQNNPTEIADLSVLSVHRRYLLELLQSGLRGQGIGVALNELEREIIFSCENEIQRRLAVLPLISLFPLLFLIFPSLMLLLLVPLLQAFKL